MDIMTLLATASAGYLSLKVAKITSDVLGEYLKPLMKMSGEAHAEYIKGVLGSNRGSEAVDDLHKSPSQVFAEESYNLQLHRLLQILEKAVPLLDENASSPSPQWSAKFRKDAAHIIDEDLQVLWANVLVSECNSPGSVNSRVLSRIAELNRSDAVIFNKFLAVTANNAHILAGKGSQPLDYADLTFNDLLQMVEAGLIHSEIAHNVEYKIYSFGDSGPLPGLTYYHEPHTILLHSSNRKFVSPLSYSLSQVGQALSLALRVTPAIDKLTNIYQQMRDRGYELVKIRLQDDRVIVDTSFTPSSPIQDLFRQGQD